MKYDKKYIDRGEKMKRYKKWIIPSIVVMLVIASTFYQNRHQQSQENSQPTHLEQNVKQCIWVDIKGAVNKPNLYCVKKDSMIEEIAIVAGGFHHNADLTTINRVSRIQSESMILIPYIKEIEAKKISINQATIDELMKIPFIGESKAKAIIEYRTKNGRFLKIDDITKVSGIGIETFNKIKDYISL
jgi:competence protein ComEA